MERNLTKSSIYSMEARALHLMSASSKDRNCRSSVHAIVTISEPLSAAASGGGSKGGPMRRRREMEAMVLEEGQYEGGRRGGDYNLRGGPMQIKRAVETTVSREDQCGGGGHGGG